MNRRKVISFGMAAVMTAGMLAGCGGTGTTATSSASGSTSSASKAGSYENAKVEINGMVAEDTDLTGEFTYWSAFTGDSQTWDQSRVDLFNELYADKGIKCNVQFVPDGAGVNNGKLLSAIAGGTGPDVFISDNPTSVYTYATNGSLEDLSEPLDKVGINLDDFFPGCKDVIYYKDTPYLIPQDANVIMLYYNPDIATEVGLDPDTPPTTLEELDQWADAMTKVDADGNYERFGLIPWLDSGNDAFVVPYIMGCDPYDAAANKLDLTSDTMVNYLEWVQSYAQKYNPEKIQSFTSGLGGMFSPDHAFMRGKVGMTITGNWFSNALKIYAPDVNYKVCAVPVPEGGRANSTTFGVNVFGIPTGAKNAELATLFIKFCLSSQVNDDNFKQWRSIPTSDAAFDDVSLTKEGDEMYALEREIANSPENGIPALCSVSAELSTSFQAFRESVIYSNADIKAGLQELQDKFQKQLDAEN
ncbi:MAG: extracellular solute-binding protein [Lachnospiraceae bacterium]|nr:extracellular solute-binding protein [Lachnospiraceae bacterium]